MATPSVPNAPSVPGTPTIPCKPGFPNSNFGIPIPGLRLPGIPRIPNIKIPSIPNIIPKFKIPGFLRNIKMPQISAAVPNCPAARKTKTSGQPAKKPTEKLNPVEKPKFTPREDRR